jgi:catechol 2,3-dioxygenase-like lactoylglutathione lyase family enzyme
MTAEIERLVCCFDRGAMSRRELIAGLGALCAAPTAAAGAVVRRSVPQSGQGAPIPVGGIDHIALRVSDLARSIAFYRDHLGGRIRSQSSNSTFLDVGSQWVALFGRDAVSTGYEVTQPGVDHISFHSSRHRSLAERMGVLRDHGLDPVSPAGSNRVYFRDPDGIILQLS